MSEIIKSLDWNELLITIWTVILLPLLTYAGNEFRQWAKAKKIDKYTDILEKNVYKGVDATRIEEAIAKDINLRQRHIEVITVYNTQNKDQRIMTITDKINSGQVLFNENDVDYNKQVQEFRGQKFTTHDDAIDSLEMAINNIDQVVINHKIVLLDRRLLGL